MDRSDQLARGQRSHSYQNITSAFSPLSQLTSAASNSSLHRLDGSHSVPVTPLLPPRRAGTAVAGEGEIENHFPFDAVYSARGFEVDPFSSSTGHGSGSNLQGRMRRKESLGVGKGAYGTKKAKSAVFYRDSDWADRLSAKASRFGSWTEGESRVEEWSGRCQAGDETDSDASNDDDEDVAEEHAAVTIANPRVRYSGEQGGKLTSLARTRSSLSVFHDEFEESDEALPAGLTSTSTSTSPFSSPNPSHSRLSSLSFTPTSPQNDRRSSLPPQSPSSSIATPATDNHGGGGATESPSEGDIDILAHSVLASQDRFGLFAYIESFLEWPWSPRHAGESTLDLTSSSSIHQNGERSPQHASSSYATSPALSRVASFRSLSESGELSAYYRAKSESDLKRKLEWEKGDRDLVGLEKGLGIAAGMGNGLAERKDKGDGIGTVMDVLAGLNNFL